MEKVIRPVLITAAFLLIAGCVFAGESVTVKVSCTIPAIPGVNAPLEESTASSSVQSVANAVSSGQINTQDSGEAGSREGNNDEGQKIEQTEGAPLVLVKTIYTK